MGKSEEASNISAVWKYLEKIYINFKLSVCKAYLNT